MFLKTSVPEEQVRPFWITAKGLIFSKHQVKHLQLCLQINSFKDFFMVVFWNYCSCYIYIYMYIYIYIYIFLKIWWQFFFEKHVTSRVSVTAFICSCCRNDLQQTLARIYLLKVNNRNTRTMCEICP